MTPDNIKEDILANIWMDYRSDEEFQDFIQYNDMGLPLAYMLVYNIVKPTDLSRKIIDESFNLLLGGLGIKEDKGFESLDEILDLAIVGESEE